MSSWKLYSVASTDPGLGAGLASGHFPARLCLLLVSMKTKDGGGPGWTRWWHLSAYVWLMCGQGMGVGQTTVPLGVLESWMGCRLGQVRLQQMLA